MRKEAMNNLFALTKEQETALQSEDIARFEELMLKKQVEIDYLTVYNEGNKETLTEEEKRFLKEIINLDQKNRKEFDRQYEEAKQKVKDIRRNKNTHNVYSNPYNVWQEEGLFFDKK